MTAVWTAVGVLTVVCFAIKAAGPVALGGRELPRVLERVIGLLPAALLTALVATQIFGDPDRQALALDARAAGLAAAVIAAAARAPMLVVLLAATLTTALLRL